MASGAVQTGVYTSPFPDIQLASSSIFTHFLNTDKEGYVGHHPAHWPAYIESFSGTAISRAQLRTHALSLGYALQHHPHYPAKRGDVTMLYSPNSVSFPLVVFGCIAAGVRVTLANAAYNPRELEHQYKDSGATLIFTFEEGLPTVLAMLKEMGIENANDRVIVCGKGTKWVGGPDVPRMHPEMTYMEDLLAQGTLEHEEKFEGEDAHETAFLCYSSGTTGLAKGVETTHQNLTSVVEMVMESLPDLTQKTASGVLPFFHIYGAVNLFLLPLRAGFATAVQPRFDPEQFCANIQRYRVAFCLLVPPIMNMLARHPVVEKYDLSSLQVIISGAAPLPVALTKIVRGRLRSLKCFAPIVQGYGLTETSPVTHLVPHFQATEENIGSIGVLMPSLQCRLVGEDNLDVEAGQPGEMWIKGPTVMKGYHNRAAETKDTITADGWLKTGDVAIRDSEGFYTIVDRKKELIKYKGFQVPPAELEDILCGHPEIIDAAVIAVYDDEQATELPRGYVVSKRQLTTTEERVAFEGEIKDWVKGRVAYHKQLRGGVSVIEAVPKSAAGKILRKDLRAKAKLEREQASPAIAVKA
ncbi:AMP binding protein [Cylindrobasidium torrendii FP15055 ss-10]|uniref:AMP binding protein n=1 Tax=Cylindrobasidium torrendii FP15055 ss-10 TaxID=1314674 RepID=A0A0D7AXY6_9AGAR|nr:AMP binding protein [Cylindrobasidium torrendii FP15055 ss-10]